MISHFVLPLFSLIDASVFLLTIIVWNNRLWADVAPGLRTFTSILIWLSSISFLYFLSLVAGFSFPVFLLVFSGLMLLSVYFNLSGFKRILTADGNIWSFESCLLWMAILMSCFYFFFHGSKYGDFDAWAHWNRNGRFLYFHQYWKNAFADHNPLFHSDYPLMLPAVVAFFWHATGSYSFVVPLVFSLLVIIGIQLFLYYALRDTTKYGQALGLAALFLMLADTNFQMFDNAQCGDMLLSLFILATIVLNQNILQLPSRAVYLLGFISASCMWIKNEGILFFLIFAAVFVLNNRKNLRYISGFLIGALIPVLIVMVHKLLFAPANDLVKAGESQVSRIVADVSDIQRYITIAVSVYKVLFTYFWSLLLMLVLLIVLNIRGFCSSSFLVLGLLFAGYMAVYLTTPYSLIWHLDTSLNRLLDHIYPSVIYLGMFNIGKKNLSLLTNRWFLQKEC